MSKISDVAPPAWLQNLAEKSALEDPSKISFLRSGVAMEDLGIEPQQTQINAGGSSIKMKGTLENQRDLIQDSSSSSKQTTTTTLNAGR